MAGRKPTPHVEQDHPTANAAALAAASAALTVVGARSAEIAERFGDGQPYERSRVVSEARFFMAQGAEAMLELGKRLVQIKEAEPHGEFIEIVTERLGLGERSARLMMSAAVKFLAPKRQAFAVLGKSKLYDLLVEPDDELDALAEGGTLAGLDLDDMQTMSVRELRTALTDARQLNGAKDKVIAKKDAKLNKLAEAAELRGAIGTDEAATLLGLRDATLSAEIALAQLSATVGAALNGAANEATAIAARSSAEYVAQRLADLLAEHGIPVDFEQRITPDWLIEPGAAKAPKR